MNGRRLAVSAAVGLLVASVPVLAPAPAEATGCASKAEYRSLPINQTKTPGWVQVHFGVRGRIIDEHVVFVGSRYTVYTTMRYPACWTGHRVYVRYVGSAGHPAVAYWKKYA